MEDRTHNLDEDTLIAERAVEWLHRLDSAGAHHNEPFLKWLRRSPQNGGELLVAMSNDVMLRQLFRGTRFRVDPLLAESANVLSIAKGAPRKNSPRGRRLRLFAVASLSIAATTAVLILTPTFVRRWLHPNEHTTSVRELRAIELPDGSVIAVNTQSSLRVDVYLNDGQTMFRVAKDPNRPFRVHVDASAGSHATQHALDTKPTATIEDIADEFQVTTVLSQSGSKAKSFTRNEPGAAIGIVRSKTDRRLSD